MNATEVDHMYPLDDYLYVYPMNDDKEESFIEFIWNEFQDILFGKGKIQSMMMYLERPY
jgi:hypothetical protein